MASLTSNREAIGPDQVAALVVTYFPDSGLAERLCSLRMQFDRIALIDNGSSNETLSAITAELKHPGVSLHRNSSNLGIATALNQGMKLLADEGFGWVVTFDQDSVVEPGFLAAHLATLSSHTSPDKVAMVGANRMDPDSEGHHRWLRPRKSFPYFERVTCEEASQGVTLVITSGTMTNVSIFIQLGSFRDELFIDMVDSEYCLRARKNGYITLVSCEAKLVHKVGALTRHSILGVRVASTHHSPMRRYYLFRNFVHVLRDHGRSSPHWLMYEILALCEVMLAIMGFESDKWRKMRACLLGFRDGIGGKAGPATDITI